MLQFYHKATGQNKAKNCLIDTMPKKQSRNILLDSMPNKLSGYTTLQADNCVCVCVCVHGFLPTCTCMHVHAMYPYLEKKGQLLLMSCFLAIQVTIQYHLYNQTHTKSNMLNMCTPLQQYSSNTGDNPISSINQTHTSQLS